MRKMIFAAFCIMACSISALAQARPVPEIDGGSLLTALALVGGGILVLRARYGSR